MVFVEDKEEEVIVFVQLVNEINGNFCESGGNDIIDMEEVINGFKVEEGILEVEDIVKRDEDDVKLEVMIIELEDSVNEDREFWVEKLREDDGFNI